MLGLLSLVLCLVHFVSFFSRLKFLFRPQIFCLFVFWKTYWSATSASAFIGSRLSMKANFCPFRRFFLSVAYVSVCAYNQTVFLAVYSFFVLFATRLGILACCCFVQFWELKVFKTQIWKQMFENQTRPFPSSSDSCMCCYFCFFPPPMPHVFIFFRG